MFTVFLKFVAFINFQCHVKYSTYVFALYSTYGIWQDMIWRLSFSIFNFCTPVCGPIALDGVILAYSLLFILLHFNVVCTLDNMRFNNNIIKRIYKAHIRRMLQMRILTYIYQKTKNWPKSPHFTTYFPIFPRRMGLVPWAPSTPVVFI